MPKTSSGTPHPEARYYTFDQTVVKAADYPALALAVMPVPDKTLDQSVAVIQDKIKTVKDDYAKLPPLQSGDILVFNGVIVYNANANKHIYYEELIKSYQKTLDAYNERLHSPDIDGPAVPLTGVEVGQFTSEAIPINAYLVRLKKGGVRIINMSDPRETKIYDGTDYDAALKNFQENADNMPDGYMALARPKLPASDPLAQYVKAGGDFSGKIGHSGWSTFSKGLTYVAIGAGLFIPVVGEAEVAGLSAGAVLFALSTAAGVGSISTDWMARAQTEGGLRWDERMAGDVFNLALQLGVPAFGKFAGKILAPVVETNGSMVFRNVDSVTGLTRDYIVTAQQGKRLAEIEQNILSGGKSEAELDALYAEAHNITDTALFRSSIGGTTSPRGGDIFQGYNTKIISTDKTLVQQMHDYTCAPASMKMVLTDLLGEEQIASLMLSESMLRQLAGTIADTRGLVDGGTTMTGVAKGFNSVFEASTSPYVATAIENMTVQQLSEIAMREPVVVALRFPAKLPDGTKAAIESGHAVVVDSIKDGVVVLRDPLSGQALQMSLQYFEYVWKGKVVTISPKQP